MQQLNKHFILQCAKGNRIAQKNLFEQLYAPMLRVCLRYMGHIEDAEDCTMKGFVKSFQHLPTFKYENNLEALKNKFVQDYYQSAKEKDFPNQPKNVVYMVERNGRRRLKAIPDDNVPFNLKDEIKDFKNNYPAFHYTIYDLPASFSYHIYVSSPEDLNQFCCKK